MTRNSTRCSSIILIVLSTSSLSCAFSFHKQLSSNERINQCSKGIRRRICDSFHRKSVSVSNAVKSHTEETDTHGPIANVQNANTSDPNAKDLIAALIQKGFRAVRFGDIGTTEEDAVFVYNYQKATNMLKLVENAMPKSQNPPPRWITVVSGEENLLVANGWSFLDPDETEPLSSYDVDAANEEGTYRPKWSALTGIQPHTSTLRLSSLGYDLSLSTDAIRDEAKALPSITTGVLLEGDTDERNRKVTANGISFAGSIHKNQRIPGIFVTAIGNLPLFSSDALSPSTASSGWLTFVRPLASDHVVHVDPVTNSEGFVVDNRIEVVCARTKCHLGHYFGPGEGYCINASALTFLPINSSNPTNTGTLGETLTLPVGVRPVSYTSTALSPLPLPLASVLAQQPPPTETILLGAGCFWHVEFALRRLPGIISTEVGFAGGDAKYPHPTYRDVCKGDTNHAEVVKVVVDPTILEIPKLLDCFFAMHDATSGIRALGKNAVGSGQYRSCIFGSSRVQEMSNEVLDACALQLDTNMSTEINDWEHFPFWKAEERHQQHDEKQLRTERGTKLDDLENSPCSTISILEWLTVYGERAESVWGSSETTVLADDAATTIPRDDGMARFMI